MNENFIEAYTETVAEQIDAPIVFIKASAYWLVSSLLGRFFQCKWFPLLGRPNEWFLLSSMPGRTRRSTIQELAEDVYRGAYTDFLMKHEDVSQETASNIVDDSLVEESTPEGILDHIIDCKLNAYSILSGEFGAVLKRMTMRDYEAGMLSLLSKMYYGEGGSMYLSRRGGKVGVRRLPRGLYVTMLAGMQEPKYYITPDMIRQGLLRRIVLCYVERSDRWMPPLKEKYEDLRKILKEKFAPEFAEKMVELSEIADECKDRKIEIRFIPRVIDSINDYAKKLDADLDREPTNVNIYRQSLWEHLAKLSMLNAIARGRVDLVAGENVVNVTEDDYSKADAFLQEAVKNSDKAILSIAEREQPIRTAEQPLDRVYRIIASAGSGGISRSELHRKTNMISKDLDEILYTLRESGKVKWEVRKTGGRDSLWYVAVE
jgi:hypothetical protein